MCRMMAKAAAADTSILDEMTTCPRSMLFLSKNGRVSSGLDKHGEHRDGCGFAYFQDGKLIRERRGQADVWNASYIDAVRAARSNLFLAHDRKASPGLHPDATGAHPLIAQKDGIEIAFCHNGTVNTYLEAPRAGGTSDTALYFTELLRRMDAVTPEELAKAVNAISKETSYSSLTAMMMTRNWLCVWRIHATDVDPEKLARYSAYYTMHYLKSDNAIDFASEPLDDSKQWQLMPNRTFITIDPEQIGNVSSITL